MNAAGARALLDFLLPPGCLTCGSWRPDPGGGTLLCGPCRSRLPRASWPRCPRCHLPVGTGRTPAPTCRECRAWPPALGHARFAWVLRPPASDMVHALKYEGWAELAGEMGHEMAGLSLPGTASRRRVVVPVPTTARREKRRGYNQAALLAHAFASHRGWAVVDALRRTDDGGTQVALHPSERLANVKGVFIARERGLGRVRGAHVLLVDDVLTTGATAAEAAVELARMGATGVTLVAFARALPKV